MEKWWSRWFGKWRIFPTEATNIHWYTHRFQTRAAFSLMKSASSIVFLYCCISGTTRYLMAALESVKREAKRLCRWLSCWVKTSKSDLLARFLPDAFWRVCEGTSQFRPPWQFLVISTSKYRMLLSFVIDLPPIRTKGLFLSSWYEKQDIPIHLAISRQLG